MVTIREMYDLEHTLAKEYLSQFTYPGEALGGLKNFIIGLGKSLDKEDIGPGTEVRHCAFVRGSALVGANCVVGNSVELKNVILFDNVQTPHYNYVGDSILGYKSHMGAGSITSNVKSDKTLVVVHNGNENIETGLKKFGAMLGDCVEVGCNSVLNPGTVIGANTNIYPLSCVRGVVPPNSIFKTGALDGEIIVSKRC